MQIPPELTPLYRADGNSTASADHRKTEPIGESSTLESALSESAGDPQAHLAPPTYGPLPPNGRGRARKTNRYRGEERRKEDRRQQNLPVLIDTRISRSRRASWQKNAINVRV